MAFWKKKQPAPEMVRIYDPDTGIISTIPAAELAPGMIRVNVRVSENHIEENVWMDASKAKPSPYRHPPFPDEIRQYFQTLSEVLDEVDPKTIDEWEDGFRRDQNWEPELQIFLHVAEVYSHLIRGRDYTLGQKRDIYRVLIGCTISPRDQILNVVDRGSLSREQALEIIEKFFS